MTSPPETIVVAGATGTNGREFIDSLSADAIVIGLSDLPELPVDARPNLRWRHCDLYSLSSATRALGGADRAIYVDHAAPPYARLVQGTPADFELMRADTFARAAESAGVKQIVLVGRPEWEQGNLSVHLHNFAEIAEALGQWGAQVTVLPADSACDIGRAKRPASEDPVPVDRSVRSIQRLSLPLARSAQWAADEYLKFLPTLVRRLFSVRTTEDGLTELRVAFIRPACLILRRARERSTKGRQVFDIIGGVLVRSDERAPGRFEFRTVLGGRALITAVHDYRPALPWAIYRSTQAPFHSFVMWRFGRHLSSIHNGTGTPDRMSGP